MPISSTYFLVVFCAPCTPLKACFISFSFFLVFGRFRDCVEVCTVDFLMARIIDATSFQAQIDRQLSMKHWECVCGGGSVILSSASESSRRKLQELCIHECNDEFILCFVFLQLPQLSCHILQLLHFRASKNVSTSRRNCFKAFSFLIKCTLLMCTSSYCCICKLTLVHLPCVIWGQS